MHDLMAFSQRLKKNLKKRQAWAKQWQTNAFRLYHLDIPELRYSIDCYGEHLVVSSSFLKVPPHSQEELIDCLHNTLEVPRSSIHLKYRQRIRSRGEQYERVDDAPQDPTTLIVQEQSNKYLVNLSDYLDTGLFLDHRPLRALLRKSGPVPIRRIKALNLYSYTGSISVALATAAAQVTSVDLSNTYLQWAQENFRLNNIPLDDHHFIAAPAEDFLSDKITPAFTNNFYDIIVLDPPTFSNSKKMRQSLDIQRDHSKLIQMAMKKLAPQGVLWFSTNFTKFALDPIIPNRFHCEEWTKKTVPPDFSAQTPIHRSFRITSQSQ